MTPIATELSSSYSTIFLEQRGIDGSVAPVFMDKIPARASMSERRKIQELGAVLGHAAEKQAAWTDLLHMLVPYYFFDRELGEKFISAATLVHFILTLRRFCKRTYLRTIMWEKKLKGLPRPDLILQGHQDPMPESVAEQTHAIIQGSQLAFLNRWGHFPWLEQPSAFYEQVRSFLEAAQK